MAEMAAHLQNIDNPQKHSEKVINIQAIAIQFVAAISDEISPISLISQDIARSIFKKIQNTTLNIICATFDNTMGTLVLCQICGDTTCYENIATKPRLHWLFGAEFTQLNGELFAFDCRTIDGKDVSYFSKFTRISANNWKERSHRRRNTPDIFVGCVYGSRWNLCVRSLYISNIDKHW
ncbi:MAG: hypothetical protein M0R33_19040 [Methylomonas sp.]|jgi:hypothetical protein|uniref:hypothetical protein n=1 Tax=Methylomonas sp. TaxID=418 RepID=UPI0025E99030|nr:hypothetical protein [Methylomonas sp.]MCK9608542.1 hypothetical protein [Methylomonas sp.]